MERSMNSVYELLFKQYRASCKNLTNQILFCVIVTFMCHTYSLGSVEPVVQFPATSLAYS